MSKTLAVLLALAFAWLTAWEIASHFMRKAGATKLVESEHVAAPAGRLERGADVRVEGVLAEGPKVAAPFSGEPCLAAVTRVFITSTYRDSQDKQVQASTLVATRRAGPALIDIDAGATRIQMPVELWSPRQYTSAAMSEVPARLAVTAAEIAAAKEQARGSIGSFSVTESALQSGTRYFVVGKLEDGDGPLRLGADRVLQRVELYAGSQSELVDDLRRSGGGLRVAGVILGAGVAPLPLVIIGAVLVLRRRR